MRQVSNEIEYNMLPISQIKTPDKVIRSVELKNNAYVLAKPIQKIRVIELHKRIFSIFADKPTQLNAIFSPIQFLSLEFQKF